MSVKVKSGIASAPRFPCRSLLVAAVISALAASPQPAAALPQVGQVVRGSASIGAPSAASMTINQNSARAIVNWRSFSVGAGEAVRINQPSVSSAILNRVTGNDMSAIYGRLQSNGQVYLLNPHGILVGPSGQIDTAGFIASTLHTSNEEFMGGGKLTLQGSSSAGIVNLGTINASDGNVALIAAEVDNHGTILAPNGTAALASGSKVLYAPGSEDDILIEAPAPATGGAAAVNNSGMITAARAELKAAGSAYALAVNNGGQISATAVHDGGGEVVIDAGAGDAASSGLITAHAGDKGGSVDVLGSRVALTGSARVDASGPAGGGTVRIGGGAHGQGTATTASTVTVAKGATIAANAITAGNGGTVTLWSQDHTSFDGAIEAKGGAESGNGGFIETSGAKLTVGGDATVDTSAPYGIDGDWLLDPTNFTIATSGGDMTPSYIETTLNSTNVTASASGSVTVSSPISNATTIKTLALDAPTVAIDANISLPNGELDFGVYPNDYPYASVTSTSTSALSANVITVYGNYPTVDLSGPVSAGSFGYPTTNSTLSSLIVNNSSNAIQNLNLTNGTVSLTGDVDVRSTTAMLVANQITTAGNITLVAGGNLEFGGGGPTLNADGTTTLASTGGVFDDNSKLSLGGTGRKLIYSSTDGANNGLNFNVAGLNYTQYNPVSYPNDPDCCGNVIYIQTASGLQLLKITADGKIITYGSPDPTFTASYTGGSASDLTAPVQFQVSGAHSNVGSYSIVPFGATSSTYQLSFVDGTLTVDPATLTITANDLSRAYGSANPSLMASNSGLFNGDTLASVVPDLTLSTPAATASNVGTYAITPSGTSASSNYTLQLVPGTLTVDPAPLVITANNASKIYGAANPSFSAQYSGLVNGDTSSVVSGLALSSDATAASPAESIYLIVPSGASASNYTISYFDGTLAVDPAPLTVTADDASKTYGAANPSFSAQYSGLVNGDTAASLSSRLSGLALSTSATSASPVGTYAIVPSGIHSPNYTVQYLDGTLTVGKAPLSLYVNDATRQVDTPNPAFSATIKGLKNGDPPSVVSGITFKTAATIGSPLGTYPILGVSPGSAANYIPTFAANGTLTVDNNEVIISSIHIDPSKFIYNGFSLTPSQPVVVDYDFLGGGNPSIGLAREESHIVDQFVSALNESGAKINSGKIFLALADPKTRDGTLGAMLPFLYQNLQNILALKPAQRSGGQQEFITAIENYIHKQKMASAKQAEDEYTAWYNAENEKVNGAANSKLGIAGIELSEIEAANPDSPPPDFLEQAQAGMVMTNDQLKSYAGAMSTVAYIGDHARGYAGGATAEVGKAILLFGKKADPNELVRHLPVMKKIFVNARTRAQILKKMAVKAKLQEGGNEGKTTDVVTELDKSGEAAAQAGEDAAKTLETISEVGKIASGIGKVAEMAGPIGEVVGNVIQIAVGVVGYATIGQYKTALDQARDAANKSVTDSDLKSMSAMSLFSFVTAMAATGGQVGSS
jgi:filamentous hemagglutinin family protein